MTSLTPGGDSLPDAFTTIYLAIAHFGVIQGEVLKEQQTKIESMTGRLIKLETTFRRGIAMIKGLQSHKADARFRHFNDVLLHDVNKFYFHHLSKVIMKSAEYATLTTLNKVMAILV